jgi:hypothetical protein
MVLYLAHVIAGMQVENCSTVMLDIPISKKRYNCGMIELSRKYFGKNLSRGEPDSDSQHQRDRYPHAQKNLGQQDDLDICLLSYDESLTLARIGK